MSSASQVVSSCPAVTLLGREYAGGKGSGFGVHSLGERHQCLGPGRSPGLAWETESLAPTMSTGLLQANSYKSKVEVKMG